MALDYITENYITDIMKREKREGNEEMDQMQYEDIDHFGGSEVH